MREHRRLMVMIVLFAVVLVAGLAIVWPLATKKSSPKKVDLTCSTNPQDVVIQVEGGGGPPPPWADYIPAYRLFGDGTVIRQDPNPSTINGLMVQGKLDQDQVGQLLQQVKDTGFFDLEADYGNDQIMDGSYTVITVQLASERKQVLVYMTTVPAFTQALTAILDYPLQAITDYVPPEGYLAVMTYRGGSIAALGPDSPAYAVLPDLATLSAAAANDAPVPIDGAALVTLKKLESQQQYLGFLVSSDSGDLVVYPVYRPRSTLQNAAT